MAPTLADVAVAVLVSIILLAAQPAAEDFSLCCSSSSGPCEPAASGFFPNTKTYPDYDSDGDGYADTENTVYMDFRRRANRCWDMGHTPLPGYNCLPVEVEVPDPAPPPGPDPAPPPGPGIVGDPHVTGFDGSDYLLWGKPNATYNLISERSHHVNVRLYQPPSLPAGHALFIDAVGILVNDDTRLTVHLEPQPPAAGPTPQAALVLVIHNHAAPAGSSGNASKAASFRWTGQPVEGTVGPVSYAFKTPSHITIASQDIAMSIVLVDGDHLDVSIDNVSTAWIDVHGIMGQTHGAAFQRNKQQPNNGGLPASTNGTAAVAVGSRRKLALQGGEDDYITSGLLMADDKFSRFVGAAAAAVAPPALVATRKLLSLRSDVVGVGAGVKVQSAAGVSVQAAGLLEGGRRRSLLATATEHQCVLISTEGTKRYVGYWDGI